MAMESQVTICGPQNISGGHSKTALQRFSEKLK